MNEYIINSIKKFKIKNDVNSDVFIHEYYTYTYKKVKYIDIYVYKKNKNIGCININNSYPIFINFVDGGGWKQRGLADVSRLVSSCDYAINYKNLDLLEEVLKYYFQIA